jgi:uncharacterized protein (UPF0179 family)
LDAFLAAGPVKIVALVDNALPSTHEAAALLEPAKLELKDIACGDGECRLSGFTFVVHHRNREICKVSSITDYVAPLST